MHNLSPIQKASKVYPIDYSITMDTDKAHQKANYVKAEQARNIQQKKNIDKILQSIVKERLFGNFITEDKRVSKESYHTIDAIYKDSYSPQKKGSLIGVGKDVSGSRKDSLISARQMYSDELIRQSQRSRTLKHYQTKSSCSHHTTNIRLSTNGYDVDSKGYLDVQKSLQTQKKRNLPQKLPHLNVKDQQKQHNISKGPIFHAKKLQINQKNLVEFFKKFNPSLPLNVLIYQAKVSRQNIVNKYKNLIDGRILQRFFHFFSFPQVFGIRQYINLIENASNCNLKFIYFFIFSLFDEVANGVLTSQDLFQFLQRLYNQDEYIEKQVYTIQNYLEILRKTKEKEKQKNGGKLKQEKQSEVPVQEIAVINHAIKLQQLKSIMKQSNKQIIDVQCLKNTCYSYSLLSVQHDPAQRQKKKHLQKNQQLAMKLKAEANQAKERLKKIVGLRLRDFYVIYQGKRPKIFCYLLSLLINIRPQDYQ